MLATNGECLFLIGLEHLQALWAQNSLLERHMMHIAKLEGDITAPTDYPTRGNGDLSIVKTGEPTLTAKLITVGFPIGRHMTYPKRVQ